jgi:hypothetical protein
VFLVHGMGAYVDPQGKLDPAWHQGALEALSTAADEQEVLDLNGDRLASEVEFVPVHYDHIFHELARNWESNSETLGKFQQFAALADLFTGAGELKENFFWTHVADVMMYFASPIVRRAVIESVKAQLLERLQDDTIAKWSVIAHSLGTAVAHDAVDDFIREYHVEKDQYWYTPPQLLAMISNVSRVLQRRNTSVYASHAAPHITGCKAFLTADHDYDPFTWPRPFRPSGGVWDAARDPFAAFRYFDPTGLNHVHLPEDLDPADLSSSPLRFLRSNSPHDFSHYVANPRVHLPILAWLSGQLVESATVNEAAAAYRVRQRSAATDAIRDIMMDKVEEATGLSSDEELTFEELFGRLKAIVEKWRL